MTLTFYIVSDRINKKSTDKKRMNQVAAAFQALGHNTVIGSRDPNAHTNPQKLGCTGKNDVFVCIFGGVDIEVISDHTGYKQSNWFSKRIKNAKLMYIFVKQPGGVDVATAKKVSLCHDCKGNIPGLVSIANPAKFLKNHGITWIQDTTTANIINKIRDKAFQGAGLALDETKSSTTTETQENKYTVKHGYNTSTHFEGYLKIDYTVNKSKKIKTILIDFASKAPDSKYSFINEDGLVWNNNKKYIHEIDLLTKIAKAEGNPNLTRNDEYHLKKVTIMRNFEHMKDDKSTADVDESKLYDAKKEDSIYKMNIYDLGVFSGETINQQTLGVSGKSLLDCVNEILKKSNYYFNIIYGNRRDNDSINFTEVDNVDIVETFEEGFDGNIIGINNVKYSPASDLINNSIILYKSVNENSEIEKYRYARKSRINDVLRYGEQTYIDNMSDDTGFIEASQKSYDNLMEYYKPDTTCTVKVVGLPLADVNDYVALKTINPLLTNEYKVKSRQVNIKVNTRPVIQTDLGCGDVDNVLKVKNNLAKQRRELVVRKLDLNAPAQYIDDMTNNVWID